VSLAYAAMLLGDLRWKCLVQKLSSGLNTFCVHPAPWRSAWVSKGAEEDVLAFVWLSYRPQRRPCSPIRTRLVSRRPLQVHGEGEAVLIGGQKGALLNEERLFGRPRCCSRLASLVRMLVSQRASSPLRFRKRDNDHARRLPSDQRSEGQH
jgi:hypothetical protein